MLDLVADALELLDRLERQPRLGLLAVLAALATRKEARLWLGSRLVSLLALGTQEVLEAAQHCWEAGRSWYDRGKLERAGTSWGELADAGMATAKGPWALRAPLG